MDINEPNQHHAEFDYSTKQNLIPAYEQSAILAQIANKAERKLKLRWILAISSLPLFGIYAAFGIAPQTMTSTIATATVVEEITLPDAASTQANIAEQHFWYKDHVRRDDTLNNLLSRLNVHNLDAINFIRSDAVASEITSALKPSHNMKAQTDGDGNLISLEYQLDTDQFINVTQTASGYSASKVTHKLESRPILKSAKIRSSLFGATDDANIPDDVAIQVAEMFESQIDFNKDLRRGDQFNVIYEGSYDEGELVKTGEVLAAEFVNNGKTYQAVGYRDASGEMQYYTPDGKSLHKSFLRSPLEFTRVSSSFSTGRFHPILQRLKAHQGVDLAAPSGTRVKASGEAVVDFVGQKGGYGNVIVLKHENGVRTVYGHLSRFADGLHRGRKVVQGDVIGFVGMTGLATGPHLHYEFMVNGEHRDPMTVALPKADPITGQNKIAFDAISHDLTAQIGLLGNSNIAALE
ncbi:MAG: M23 family metallopeptidase [Methylotenera sp.]|uniref:M23 family metallopeptidase n=1 Tax=Methylotenera sp. TaxID=2051956 RepID=UPI00248A41BB|nr:M23 family metallopeptidase [Methylotenera sp.]MDI1309056.1 M23 family metallopeptidase [Methylotenera sp.]